jgi:hypothetical protein
MTAHTPIHPVPPPVEPQAGLLTPEQSQAVAEDAFFRQTHHKPAKPLKRWRVSSPRVNDGAESIVRAIDENDAWAQHCDAQKVHPGSRTKNLAKIVVVTEESEEEYREERAKAGKEIDENPHRQTTAPEDEAADKQRAKQEKEEAKREREESKHDEEPHPRKHK